MDLPPTSPLPHTPSTQLAQTRARELLWSPLPHLGLEESGLGEVELPGPLPRHTISGRTAWSERARGSPGPSPRRSALGRLSPAAARSRDELSRGGCARARRRRLPCAQSRGASSGAPPRPPHGAAAGAPCRPGGPPAPLGTARRRVSAEVPRSRGPRPGPRPAGAPAGRLRHRLPPVRAEPKPPARREGIPGPAAPPPARSPHRHRAWSRPRAGPALPALGPASRSPDPTPPAPPALADSCRAPILSPSRGPHPPHTVPLLRSDRGNPKEKKVSHRSDSSLDPTHTLVLGGVVHPS